MVESAGGDSAAHRAASDLLDPAEAQRAGVDPGSVYTLAAGRSCGRAERDHRDLDGAGGDANPGHRSDDRRYNAIHRDRRLAGGGPAVSDARAATRRAVARAAALRAAPDLEYSGAVPAAAAGGGVAAPGGDLPAGRSFPFPAPPGHARAVFYRGLCAARLWADPDDLRSNAAGGRAGAGDRREPADESRRAGGCASGLGRAGHPADPAPRAPVCLSPGAAGVCLPDGMVGGDLAVSDAWRGEISRAAARDHPGADVQRLDHAGPHPTAPAGDGRLAGLCRRVVHVADRPAASFLFPGGGDGHGHLRVGAQCGGPPPLEGDPLDAGVYPANSVQRATNRVDAACSQPQPAVSGCPQFERSGDVVRADQPPGRADYGVDRCDAVADALGDFPEPGDDAWNHLAGADRAGAVPPLGDFAGAARSGDRPGGAVRTRIKCAVGDAGRRCAVHDRSGTGRLVTPANLSHTQSILRRGT